MIVANRAALFRFYDLLMAAGDRQDRLKQDGSVKQTHDAKQDDETKRDR